MQIIGSKLMKYQRQGNRINSFNQTTHLIIPRIRFSLGTRMMSQQLFKIMQKISNSWNIVNRNMPEILTLNPPLIRWLILIPDMTSYLKPNPHCLLPLCNNQEVLRISLRENRTKHLNLSLNTQIEIFKIPEVIFLPYPFFQIKQK